MKELERYTKLEPIDRVNKTNEFLNLLSEKEKNPNHPDRLSSKEKCELYGIEVEPVKNLFNAYYMKKTKLNGENNKEVHSSNRTFPVFKKEDLTNWACFYENYNYNNAENLYNNLDKASKAYGLKIAEPEWIGMRNNSSAKYWIDITDDYFGKNKKNYDFAVL